MGSTKITPKVKIGKSIVIQGDDYQVRIFSSASQPKHPERTYHVLYEDAYGEQILDLMTEAELNKRFAQGDSAEPGYGPVSVEDMLRMANQDRSMNEYSFPAPTPIEMKDI